MMQHEKPEDFVIATGETHSVREFVELAFDLADLDWKKYVKIDRKYFRPTEVDLLVGDASKAKHLLGWEAKVKFEELVRIMLIADMKLLALQMGGFQDVHVVDTDLWQSQDLERSYGKIYREGNIQHKQFIRSIETLDQ